MPGIMSENSNLIRRWSAEADFTDTDFKLGFSRKFSPVNRGICFR